MEVQFSDVIRWQGVTPCIQRQGRFHGFVVILATKRFKTEPLINETAPQPQTQRRVIFASRITTLLLDN